jgi:mRNA (2'-O-methyladenosine-N6-)-methyltransferase
MAALTAHRAFLGDVLARQAERRKLVDKAHTFPAAPTVSEAGPSRPRAPVASNSKLNVANYVVAEETVRNDYCEWYGVSGEWGSNYVLGVGQEEICEE